MSRDVFGRVWSKQSKNISQSICETLPGTLVFPVRQLVQETEPIFSAYLPASHLSHEAALNADATYPGSHLVQPEAPADEKVPGVQSEHADTDVEPSVAAYVPPAQAVLSFGPPAHQNPTGHTAPLAETDPGGQYLPASTLHSCLSCAPPGQKNPSGHVVPAAELPNEDPSLQKLPGAAVQSVHCGVPEIETHEV